jgi:outer membrane protein OmpA-like peptidoglycan-associated protein
MKRVLPLALCLGLTGCASSYVVLLPNSDGTVGKVEVTGAHGTTLLVNAMQGTKVSAASGDTFVATPAQIQSDFAGAIAARPQRPARFVLYFEAGGTTLTPESARDLALVQQEISARKVPDISITGHTDTAGDDAQNLQLGLERAQQVRALLSSPSLAADMVTVESHGEKNLLVPTADNVAEPRNRRVEISVR